VARGACSCLNARVITIYDVPLLKSSMKCISAGFQRLRCRLVDMRLEAVPAKCELVPAVIKPCANEPRDTDDLSNVQMKAVKVHFLTVAAEQTI